MVVRASNTSLGNVKNYHHMPQLKLTYFDHTGRAEPSRLIMAAASIPFEDERLTHEQFAALKPPLPLGQVPVLQVDGKTYSQSIAISRWVVPLGPVVVDTINDAVNAIVEVHWTEKDEAKKAEKNKKLTGETLPRIYGALDKLVRGTFVTGEALSFADTHVFDHFDSLVAYCVPDLKLHAYPKLAALIQGVKAHPKLASYLAARKKSDHGTTAMKAIPFELVPIFPIKGQSRTPEFLRMNPNGQIPVLQDGDFTLSEGNAILTYLAMKHDWTDLYPSDIKARAKVDECLHWHHTHTRLATTRVMTPVLRKVVGKASAQELAFAATKHKTMGKLLPIMETYLHDHAFLAQSSHYTLADIMCYCELDQIESLGVIDFSAFPNTTRWLRQMKSVPCHDEAHEALFAFMKRFNILPVPLEHR
ncbi:TPA: hypothetical protein N0F65_007274 [Lagenidium giganteum]|uniref:Glutathione S-transferase n=1 Tax=Lagenidium giganteum TaxID=4803 RepID=A0AAV2Z7G9_9STRA|nr:TPA: hypothetical protein N0F65_007274 [Lagenidium giganteum]